jgi:acetyl esterase/lipase
MGSRNRTALAVAVAVALALVVAACTDGSTGQAAGTTAAPPGSTAARCTRSSPATVAYRRIAGADANLTSLDVYAPHAACGAPVVMWVHGGGYRTGDKRNDVAAKVRLFNGRGWVFVSVNYRLSRGAGTAQFPDHFDDVATAVAWVHRHVAAYGGDPARIALLGHSAGADIVSNVAVNPHYLTTQGLSLDVLSCAAPLDTEGFDKVTATEQAQWIAALGNNPHYRTETSATLIARRGTGIPPVLTVVRGTPERRRIETAFGARLRAIGVATTVVDASSLTHEQVNRRIGAPGDTVMTPPLVAFLTHCFA